MNEITEILTIEVTTIFRNRTDLPKLSNEQLGQLIKENFGLCVDDVVVVKQQRFIGEVKADDIIDNI